jgi:hypothetical protein
LIATAGREMGRDKVCKTKEKNLSTAHRFDGEE